MKKGFFGTVLYLKHKDKKEISFPDNSCVLCTSLLYKK